MRLLYAIDSLAGGGAETSLAEMAPYMRTAGIELHVLPLKSPLDLKERLEDGGAVVHPPAPTTSRRQFLVHTRRVVDAVHPRLIHTTLFDADLAGRLVAAFRHVPVSSSWVNQRYSSRFSDDVRASRQLAVLALDRITCKLARRFHAVSEAVAMDMAAAMGVRRRKIEIIPRGRDPKRFPFIDTDARTRIRRELGIPDDQHLVLAVGRQEPQKALHIAVDAVQELAAEGRPVTLAIAGRQGRGTAQLMARLRRARMDVRVLGQRSDIPELMAGADALAFPSEREGSPGTLIEAMAVGLPIVTTDIDPCVEVLGGEPQAIGSVVPVHDSKAMAHALRWLLDNPEERRRRASEGRRHFEQNYAIEAIGARMSTFFKETAQL